LELEGGEVFHVKERGEAQLVAAEGALPFELAPGMRYAFADLDATGGVLGTLDWRGGMDSPPELWDGYVVTAADLGLGRGGGPRAVGPFACPSCGTAAETHLGEVSATFGCPRCGAVSHRESGTWVVKGQQPMPMDRLLLPLGQAGELCGETVKLVGYRKMSCVEDGEVFLWREYMGVAASARAGTPDQRYRWLVEQDGHWNYIKPLVRSDVINTSPNTLSYQGDTFKEFSSSRTVVEQVQGEQPFATVPGDTAVAVDYVHPPHMVSVENTGNEEFWTLGEYVPPRDVEKVFRVRGEMPTPEGVAPHQPNPARGNAWWMLLITALLVAVILAVYGSVSGGARSTLVFDQEVQVAAPAAGAVAADGSVPAGTPDTAFYSQPFEIPRGNRNLQVRVSSTLDNDWLSADVALVNEATGKVRGTRVNLEYYHGSSGGETWSEGAPSEVTYLGNVPAGPHVLRVDVECAQKPCKPVRISLVSDVPRPLYAFLLIFLLCLFPLLAFLYAQYLENQRWMNSSRAALE
jgi:hypothetical protein